MRTPFLLSSACIVGLALSSPAQTIVSGGGSALGNAIAAASPGDVLIVRPGFYSPVTVSIGVAILCDPGVLLGSAISTRAGLDVRGIPAGQQFVLRGGEVSSYSPIPALLVSDSRGSVLLENVTTLLRAEIWQSDRVAIHGCELSRLTCDRSTVSIVDTRCAPSAFIFGGLVATNSRMAISGGEFLGEEANILRTGSAGLTLGTSQVVVAGDAATRIVAGPSSVYAAIELSGTDLLLDPDVTLVRVGGPPISGPGTTTMREIPSLHASPLAAGGTFTCSVRAEIGQPALLLASPPGPVTVTPFGDFWLQPIGLLQLIGGTIPPSGTLSASFAVSPSLGLGGTLMLQGLTITTNNELVIGPALGVAVH